MAANKTSFLRPRTHRYALESRQLFDLLLLQQAKGGLRRGLDHLDDRARIAQFERRQYVA